MHRRFLLIHLTPRTRELYKNFRDAARALDRIGDISHAKESLLQDATRMLDWAIREGSPSEIQHAQSDKDVALQEHQRASEKFNAAVATATQAFQAARPAMESEGYPGEWWNRGNMRIPDGLESPGAYRRRKRS